jgi:hypothetical protein
MSQMQTVSTNQTELDNAQRRVLSQGDVKRRYGLSRTRQWRLRKRGKLDYLDFGNGRVGYLLEHIEEYLLRCERRADKGGEI